MKSLNLSIRRVRQAVRTNVNTGTRTVQPAGGSYGNNNSYVVSAGPQPPAAAQPTQVVVPANGGGPL